MSSEDSSDEYDAFGVYCEGGTVNVDGNVTVRYLNTQNELPFNDFPLPKLITTFHGREQESNELDSLFFEENKHKIVLCGLPGFGKTELSKQFAQRCLDNNRVTKVLWIKAERQQDLEDSYPKLSKIYGQFSDKCLVIFDNGVCRRDIFDYEPPEKDNFFMLITSQEKDWGDDVVPLQLGTLSEESALEVLKSILGNKYDEENLALYKQLVDFIDKVPLGLQILGGYIRHQIITLESGFDLQEYLLKLKQSEEEIVKKSTSKNMPNSYEKSIYAAMVISLNKIKEEENIEIQQLSLKVLYICAYLNPDSIHINEFVKISVVKDYVSTIQDENQLDFSVALLGNYSFINKTDYYIKIHRLTQKFVQDYLNECNQHSIYYKSCVFYITYRDGLYNSSHREPVFSIANRNSDIIFDVFEESIQNVKKELLGYLVQYGCIKCLKVIFDQSERNAANEGSLLNISVRYNQIDVFKFLLGYIKLDTKVVIYKHMLLYSAAVRYHADFFEFLIHFGLEINQPDHRGRTALHGLIYDFRKRKYGSSKFPNMKRMMPILKLFIKYGARLKKIKDMSACEETISFMLKYVIHFNELEVLEWFLEDNTDANYILHPKKGVTLLHQAASSGNMEAINLIISHGADIYKVDHFGNTALFRFVKKVQSLNMDLVTVNKILDLLKCENHKDITNKSGQCLMDYVINEDWKSLILQKYELGENKQYL